MSYYCAPKKKVPWEKSEEVDAVLEDCGFSEEISESDKEKCQQQAKAPWLDSALSLSDETGLVHCGPHQRRKRK